MNRSVRGIGVGVGRGIERFIYYAGNLCLIGLRMTIETTLLCENKIVVSMVQQLFLHLTNRSIVINCLTDGCID